MLDRFITPPSHRVWVGISDTVLERFNSYFTDRTFSVGISISSTSRLHLGRYVRGFHRVRFMACVCSPFTCCLQITQRFPFLHRQSYLSCDLKNLNDIFPLPLSTVLRTLMNEWFKISLNSTQTASTFICHWKNSLGSHLIPPQCRNLGCFSWGQPDLKQLYQNCHAVMFFFSPQFKEIPKIKPYFVYSMK